jgi:nucleotide-binding universal stress UspA family protein
MFNNLIVGTDEVVGGRAAMALARELAGSSAELNPVRIRQGRVGEGLAKAAIRLDADLIVIGTPSGSRAARLLFGDVADELIGAAPCAIAIAPRGYRPPPALTRIGVGYDGCADSALPLAVAGTIAAEHAGRVIAISAISGAAGELESSQVGADLDLEVIDGPPGRSLRAYAGQLDLLVVGSRDLSRFDRLLEPSIAGTLAHGSACPVLILPERMRDKQEVDADRANGLELGRRRVARYALAGLLGVRGGE